MFVLRSRREVLCELSKRPLSIKAAIYHLTHYKYDRPVVLAPQIIRLKPAPHCKTKVLSHSLKVSPANHFVNLQQDPYGNWLSRARLPRAGHRAQDRGRSRRRHDGLQSLRLLRRGERRDLAVRISRRPARRPSIYMKPAAGRPAARRSSSPRVDRTPRNTVNFVTELNAHVQQPRSATSSAWRPASTSRRRRWRAARARAATPAGCWCRPCAISASPRASSPAT